MLANRCHQAGRTTPYPLQAGICGGEFTKQSGKTRARFPLVATLTFAPERSWRPRSTAHACVASTGWPWDCVAWMKEQIVNAIRADPGLRLVPNPRLL